VIVRWRFSRTDDHATNRARPISPRRIRLGIAGIDLRGAAGTVIRWRRRLGRSTFRRSAGSSSAGAGGSDAKYCSPPCRWEKASLIRRGGRRAQAADSPERRTSGCAAGAAPPAASRAHSLFCGSGRSCSPQAPAEPSSASVDATLAGRCRRCSSRRTRTSYHRAIFPTGAIPIRV